MQKRLYGMVFVILNQITAKRVASNDDVSNVSNVSNDQLLFNNKTLLLLNNY